MRVDAPAGLTILFLPAEPHSGFSGLHWKEGSQKSNLPTRTHFSRQKKDKALRVVKPCFRYCKL